MSYKKEIRYKIKTNGCMECISHKPSIGGYPRITRDGKLWTMSRYIYTQKHGKIPEGLVIRHICDNKMCININHLLIGTFLDNFQDMINRNRQARGESHGRAKLTENKVKEIRKLNGFMTYKAIGKIYNVGSTAIGSIINRKKWKHI